jgi:predicted XRE-type DNA-binding protein
MSRNPFLDLGALPEEATSQHIRSQLAAVLERHIDQKGWSQAEASRLFDSRVGRAPVSVKPCQPVCRDISRVGSVQCPATYCLP